MFWLLSLFISVFPAILISVASNTRSIQKIRGLGFRRIRLVSLGSYRSTDLNAFFRSQISSFVDKLNGFK